MTPYQAAAGQVVDAMVAADKRDRAFHDALLELFKQYPLHESMHGMHYAVRASALRKARAGGYCDYAPGGMIRWRNQLRENAEDWNIPADELIAIHTLIYG